MIVVYDDIYEYYIALIFMANAGVRKKEDRLLPKEIQFLARACVYINEGNDAGRFDKFAEYVVKSGLCATKKTVSHYKSVISSKRWIKSDRYTFEISDLLKKPEEVKTFKMVYKS